MFCYRTIVDGDMIYGICAVHFLMILFLQCPQMFAARRKKRNASERSAALVQITAALIHLFVLAFLHRILTGEWNILVTLRAIAHKEMCFQELAVIPTLLLASMGIALAVRCLMGKMAGLLGDGAYQFRRTGEKRAVLCVVCVLLLSIIMQYDFSFCGIRKIKLNEICVRNEDAAFNGGMDYIELRNSDSFPYQIGQDQLYLSDDENNLHKLCVGPGMVQPGETVLISLDTEANFSMGKSGGDSVFLCDSRGTIFDQIRLSAKEGSKSYCRYQTGDQWAYMNPTPGINNAEQPVFSAPAGFYADEFEVKLTCPAGYEIRYTTDGSTPTAASALYEGPIRVYDRSPEENIYRSIRNVTYDWLDTEVTSSPVDKSFTLRAIAVGPEGQISEITTASYFVAKEKYANQCVVSLTASPEDLFGRDGIYSAGGTYDDWYLGGMQGEEPEPNFEIHGLECPVNYELFMDGQLYSAQLGGLRIQGASHRSGAIKRFSVFSRAQYSGSRMFEQSIFAGKQTHSLTLRPGFENAFSMELAKGRNVSVLESIPVSVFLNGEYWFGGYMLEKYNDDYFRETYGAEQTEFYKAGITEEIKEFLYDHDLALDEEYAAFGELADIQSYIDYTCINVYLGNTDDSEYNNAGIWRTRYAQNDTYGDGRWRWCLYDMDLLTTYYRQEMGLDEITNAQVNSFEEARSWTIPVSERTLFTHLKKNEQFREQFVLTFMDLINTNFAVSRVSQMLEAWGKDITYNDSFFETRADWITGYMEEEFDLTGVQATVRISTTDRSAGKIVVNTCVPQFEDNCWTGKYYTDYPITITAEPNEGYVFVGWEGDVQGADREIRVNLPDEGVELIAVFEECK